jgi:hypothetical protein
MSSARQPRATSRHSSACPGNSTVGLRHLCTMAQRMEDFATVADTYIVQKSVETFRCRTRIQQPRHRREHVGALIQIDGSDHRWFEDRATRSSVFSLNLPSKAGVTKKPRLRIMTRSVAVRTPGMLSGRNTKIVSNHRKE